jgi:ParB-like chromosome segregation protein Spo0J
MLTGQRRFLAHKILKLKTIWAAVFDKKVDVITAKLISLTENLVRTELNNKDAIDVCTALYKHYGSIKAVVEETGLSYPKVSKYIKYDALMPELKKLVDAQTVPLATALRVQKAADWGDNIDPKKAVALAKEMSKMSGDQQQKVSEELQENPDKSISSVIKAAKTGPKGVKVVTILLQEHYQKLKSYAKTEGTTPADAAASLIVEGLEEKGFLEE